MAAAPGVRAELVGPKVTLGIYSANLQRKKSLTEDRHCYKSIRLVDHGVVCGTCSVYIDYITRESTGHNLQITERTVHSFHVIAQSHQAYFYAWWLCPDRVSSKQRNGPSESTVQRDQLVFVHGAGGNNRMSVFVAVIVGLVWGLTNSGIQFGARQSTFRPVSDIPRWLVVAVKEHWARLLLSPAYIISQLSNWAASALLVVSLGGSRLHIATPIANAVSLASNVTCSYALGDKYDNRLLIPGLLLTILGALLIGL
jgi:hypothetical protein